MKKLDVTVKLYKDGILVSGGTNGTTSGTTAVLGRAKLGKMRLGKA